MWQAPQAIANEAQTQTQQSSPQNLLITTLAARHRIWYKR